MGCCRKRTCWPPVARLCTVYDQEGQLSRIDSCTEWNDRQCDPQERKTEWEFWHEGELVYVLPFDSLNTPVSIGNGSTYSSLKLSNGVADIFDFLQTLGFEFEEGAVLKIQINTINCCGKSNVRPSNVIELGKPQCSNPWQTMASEAFLTMDDQCWQHY